MTGQVSKQEIGDAVWRACDTFRGAVDPSEYKNYILVDAVPQVHQRPVEGQEARSTRRSTRATAERVERALSRERFMRAGRLRLRLPLLQAATRPTSAS